MTYVNENRDLEADLKDWDATKMTGINKQLANTGVKDHLLH